jgi:hypothetical protein
VPRTCSVCSHPRRGDIDSAIVRNESLRSISNRFTISTMALQRHRENHIGKEIAKANKVVERRVSAVIEEKVEREQIRQLDTMTELQNIFDRMRKMLDACDSWLMDPVTGEYDLGPRAGEVMVVYLQPIGESDKGGTLFARRKATLQELVNKVEKLEEVSKIVSLETKHADPRRLIIDTANQLRASTELLAKVAGQIPDQTNQVQILNVLVNRPVDTNGR